MARSFSTCSYQWRQHRRALRRWRWKPWRPRQCWNNFINYWFGYYHSGRPSGLWKSLDGTYSEAMLISGASKQISSAILYYFRFYNLLKISSSGHHYIPGDEPKNSLRFIITVVSPMLLRLFLTIYGFFQFLLLWHIHNIGYNCGKTRCYKNEPVRLNDNRWY